jgi:hypothetical protein
MPTLTEEILSIIETEQKKQRANKKFAEKLNCVNNIIQLKLQLNTPDTQRSIYKNIKEYLKFYIKALDEKGYEYDQLNWTKVIDLLSNVNKKWKLRLLAYFERILKIGGHSDDLNRCKCEYTKTKIGVLYDEISEEQNIFKRIFICIINLLKITIHATSINVFSICTSIIIFVAVFYVALLPAPVPWMSIFNINYITHTGNFMLDHLINTLACLFDIEIGFTIHPKNVIAIVIEIIAKVIFIVVLLNYFIKQIMHRMSL